MDKRMRYFTIKILLISPLILSGCTDAHLNAQVSLQQLTDSLHQVLSADRRAYEQLIFERLEQIQPTTKMPQLAQQLPLLWPAQLFTQAAHIAQQQGATFSYVLLAQNPLNPKNQPITEEEKQALAFIETHKGQNYYGEEHIGKVKFFVAAYPEIAYAPHCVHCHNHYLQAKQPQYELNDILGAILIRVPITF
ncbi:MAG: DUF3365 domain-containing protein [Pseudomonadota bacterium]|nr:DUF3365 domain-containing protein [Pseudomonadota bacterium]